MSRSIPPRPPMPRDEDVEAGMRSALKKTRDGLARDAFNALINRNVMLPGAEGLRHAEAIARAAYMAADAMIAESGKS